MIEEITCMDDVAEFVHQLTTEGVAFHPDCDFLDFVSVNTEAPTYSHNEAQVRNRLMERCWFLCQNQKVDIHEFMLEITLKDTSLCDYIPLPSSLL